MKDIKFLLKKNWYFQGFNGTLTLLEGGARSAVVDMPQRLGYGYTAIIMYFEKDKCYFLYLWDDMFEIMKELRKRVKKDRGYLKFLNNEDKKACKESLKFFKTIKNIDQKSLAELQELFIDTSKAYANVLSVSHIVEGWVHPAENLIRNKVKNSHNLALLTSPSFDSFITKEQKLLANIANYAKQKGMSKVDNLLLKKDKKLKQMLQEHQEKWFWKNNGYASAKVLSIQYFVKELNNFIRNPRKFNDPNEIKKEKTKLLKKINDKELNELIGINDVIFRIHDRRKEHMIISMHYLELILKELKKRTNISIEHLRYLLPEETTKINAGELKSRRNKCIYFIYPGGHELFTGKKAEDYIFILEQKIKSEHLDEVKENGISPGKVKGIVKVCRGEAEISKVKKGDILVACMTQPEFIPAMKKAGAIITDEGGLTCHAAIVSRELEIPCVIGTKIATKVLKDGDYVEVDANHGVITILKRK